METILITGGTGFLGQQLAVSLKDKYRVILAARNNFLNQEASRITECEMCPLDVTSIDSVRDAFLEYHPGIVIHAAATKYVDIAEKFPSECIDVNVKGSQNVARVAMEIGTNKVIGISTDKAAPPCRGTYGLSKALMERLFCGLNGKTQTKFTCIRFGNIAWSTGSFLPIWKTMIDEKGHILTTGAHMRRFIFSVEDAARLVITAMDSIDQVSGRVLSLEMKSAQIEDILNAFIRFYGGTFEKVPERKGESIDETLIGSSELQYTRKLEINGLTYFLISFNEKQDTPLPAVITSGNAERLTYDEVFRIVSNPVKSFKNV
jgi:UDP-N-acetylglucosamine 4,6-dehydratase/5-epimerase